MSWQGDGGHQGHKGGEIPGESDRGDKPGKRRDGRFPSGLQGVRKVGNAEHLLSFGIVGDTQFVDEVNPDEVDVKVVAEHELSMYRFAFKFHG